jgi:hypothetical protein
MEYIKNAWDDIKIESEKYKHIDTADLDININVPFHEADVRKAACHAYLLLTRKYGDNVIEVMELVIDSVLSLHGSIKEIEVGDEYFCREAKDTIQWGKSITQSAAMVIIAYECKRN